MRVSKIQTERGGRAAVDCQLVQPEKEWMPTEGGVSVANCRDSLTENLHLDSLRSRFQDVHPEREPLPTQPSVTSEESEMLARNGGVGLCRVSDAHSSR